MRKIDVSPYQTANGSFNVRASLVSILFMEDRLPPREVLARDTIAHRVETTESDTLLLEESDYSKFVSGLNASDLKPFGREVVEFIRRVLDAPEVDVQERA